jgi:hypothetical protein
MEFNPEKAKAWLSGVSIALPKLTEILRLSTTEVLIIGAGVFDIYYEQNWIPAFKRKTGDLDISVGLISGETDYAVVKDALVANGYENRDLQRQYRFFSPVKIPGGLTYIDLLAHPAGASISSELTRTVMGAGSGFSFIGVEFARLEAFKIEEHLFFPNPIAMVGLKRAAYLDDPTGRIKDLADIAELAWGIVDKGMHFEMSSLWTKVKGHVNAKQIRDMLRELGEGRSVAWDLDNARQELLRRNFSGSEIDDIIPARLTEWASYLTD